MSSDPVTLALLGVGWLGSMLIFVFGPRIRKRLKGE